VQNLIHISQKRVDYGCLHRVNGRKSSAPAAELGLATVGGIFVLLIMGSPGAFSLRYASFSGSHVNWYWKASTMVAALLEHVAV